MNMTSPVQAAAFFFRVQTNTATTHALFIACPFAHRCTYLQRFGKHDNKCSNFLKYFHSNEESGEASVRCRSARRMPSDVLRQSSLRCFPRPDKQRGMTAVNIALLGESSQN